MIEPIKPSENESQPSLINWMAKPGKQRSALPDRPSKLSRNMVPVRNDLNREYANNLSKSTMESPEELMEEPEEEVRTVGIEFLAQRRMIPIGKLINQGKPHFLKFPEITDTTYNVFTFVGPMGSAKSTNVRSMIYYTNKFDPECINIIFDPMKMEFSKLAIMKDTMNKRMSLLHEVMFDPETAERIRIVVKPDTLKVFHIIPRFALNRENWDQEDMGYRSGFDKTTLAIMKKDGGFIFSEDASRMTEEQLFNCLNYREIRTDQTVHFYLRAAMRICDNKHGERNWFIQDLIDVLKENVRKFKDIAEADDIGDFDEASEDGGRLSTNELQLIEQLEKYKDIGFFVTNDDERKQYCVDWRKFIKLGRVLNISFLAFRKTDKIGEDLVRGQADLILERLIEISNEYMDAIRKTEAELPLNEWEEYLLKHWKVNLWFEESEIFMPRDCPVQNIKKWPCIKRLDYLLSFGRKFGFKNFGFITQRVTKVNPLVFKESSHLFIGPIIGEERDQILSDFGVNKISFRMIDKTGVEKEVQVRDVVTTLNKEHHEWVIINKGQKHVCACATFDSPCG
jgi:hypothetical protein